MAWGEIWCTFPLGNVQSRYQTSDSFVFPVLTTFGSTHQPINNKHHTVHNVKVQELMQAVVFNSLAPSVGIK